MKDNASILAIDLLRNEFHKPLVDGKANRVKMEDAIVDGVMEGKLSYYIDQGVVDRAFWVIDQLVEQAL